MHSFCIRLLFRLLQTGRKNLVEFINLQKPTITTDIDIDIDIDNDIDINIIS